MAEQNERSGMERLLAVAESPEAREAKERVERQKAVSLADELSEFSRSPFYALTDSNIGKCSRQTGESYTPEQIKSAKRIFGDRSLEEGKVSWAMKAWQRAGITDLPKEHPKAYERLVERAKCDLANAWKYTSMLIRYGLYAPTEAPSEQ